MIFLTGLLLLSGFFRTLKTLIQNGRKNNNCIIANYVSDHFRHYIGAAITAP